MDIEFIKDLSRKYANVCEFKSDFPHDWNSVNDGYIEGFKTAERLINENLIIHNVSKSIAIEYAEFCIRCDRDKLPILCLDDYIKQYCC